MKQKSTSELNRGLMSEADLDSYLVRNESSFSSQDITGILEYLYQRTDLSKAALARQAGMSEVYLHQVFSGRRKPSRDRLLCLCISMKATMEETQEVLKRAACAPLYPKLRRDAIVTHGILHGLSLNEINDKLFVENEKTLY